MPKPYSAGDEIRVIDFEGEFPKTLTIGTPLSATPSAVYLSTDGKIYPTDADFNDERIFNFIGFSTDATATGTPATVQMKGIVAGFSGLVIGSTYYLSGTAGTIGTPIGTYVYKVGIAITTSSLLMLEPQVPRITKVVSDNIRFSSDGEASTSADAYTLLKQITLNTNLSAVRVYFSLFRGSEAAQTVYGKLYKNGVAIGTERTSSSLTPTAYSENLSSLKGGDLIQVYGHKSVGGEASCHVNNFRLCFDEISDFGAI